MRAVGVSLFLGRPAGTLSARRQEARLQQPCPSAWKVSRDAFAVQKTGESQAADRRGDQNPDLRLPSREGLRSLSSPSSRRHERPQRRVPLTDVWVRRGKDLAVGGALLQSTRNALRAAGYTREIRQKTALFCFLNRE